MKKLILLAAAVTTVATAPAQNLRDMFRKDHKEAISYGVRAGLNISSIGGKAGATKLDYSSRAGFQVGGVVDLPVTNGFYVQPGLFFTTRGAKSEETESGTGYFERSTEKLHPFYMQIPVLASFRADVSPSVNLQINVGPYFALGLGGKAKYEYEYREDTGNGHWDTESDKSDDPFFGASTEKEDRFGAKRFDFGFSFGAGVTIREHYFVGIQYDLGAMNMAIHSDDAWGDRTKFHNGNFAVQIGYRF